MTSPGTRSGWPWILAAGTASLVVAVPVAVIFASIFRSSGGDWSHLASTRLPTYARNTVQLAIGVGLISSVVGVGVAWLLVTCRFPGARILGWAQLLPLAVPAYLSAYAMSDLLQFSGPVQGWIRASFGLQAGDYWFPAIRSMGGAIFVLSFALYPYVYFTARVAFLEQSQALLESSRTLGRGPLKTFLLVGLPLARPAIAGGIMLVLMETVADFGAVDHLAVDTFATGIYRTRYALASPVAAAQLSSVLLTAVFLVLAFERLLRRGRRYHRTESRSLSRRRKRLGPASGIAVFVLCGIPVLLGFLLPASRLVQLAIESGDSRGTGYLLELARDTATVSLLAAFVAVLLALVIGYASRVRPGRSTTAIRGIARAGYAIPGPVIALGLLLPLGWIDHRLNDVWTTWLGADSRPGLVLTGSVVALVIGYQTRFLAVGLSMVQIGLSRIHQNVDDAARVLGSGPFRSLLRIHVPLLRRSLLVAGLLVFVDVAKELPMTLMLRPFNFDTLAVRVYELASDERLGEASTAALLIVLVGMLPVVLLARQLERGFGSGKEQDES